MISNCRHTVHCFHVDFWHSEVYKAERKAKRLAILAFVGWSLLAANLVLTYIIGI